MYFTNYFRHKLNYRMGKQSQKSKNRMLDERAWMMQKCAEIEKKTESVRVGADVNKADTRGMTPLHAAGMR